MASAIKRVGVVGAGSWGTTLAHLLAEKGVTVDLWVREEEVYQQIKEENINRVFLPDMTLDKRLNPVRTFEEALFKKELILMAIPSQFFRDVLMQIKPYLKSGMSIISATKGIENDTLMIMSQVAESILPESLNDYFACLAGPSFAKEVCRKHPTAITIACRDNRHAENLQQLFFTEFFRVYISQDVIGVQLCGALKNVIAIAAGTADGLQFGHNTRAALITRGLAEISKLGVAMGADHLTFLGLAGVGDLVLTCTGDLSRNRTVGYKIGNGMKLHDIVSGMNMVAEGVKTTLSAHELGKKMGVEMPITDQVYEILYHQKDPMKAVEELMGRALKHETA